MATFREIMDAAHNADAAGDTEGAKRLLSIASDIRSGKGYSAPQQPSQASQLVLPQAEGYAPGRVRQSGEGQRDRFGDTVRSATEAPLAATKHYGGEALDSSNSAWDRTKAAGMAALSGIGTTYAFGAGLAGEMFGGSPTNEKKLARDLMMMGEVAAPELAGVSSTARAAGQAGRIASKAGDATDVQRTARSADRMGVTPALGASGKTTAQVSAGLEKVPFSGSVIAKDAQRFVGEIEEAYGRVVEGIGNARNAEGAGEKLQSGIDRFVTKFKQQSDKMFAEVGGYIPKTTTVQAPETVAMIREAIAPYADKPAIRKRLGLDEWAGLADDLESGLSWEAATSLRSKIGQSVGKINGPMADMDQGRLKQAYGSLTADLENAAKAAGPEAEMAWRRAGDYYRAGASRIEGALDKTIRADSPERAFEAFVNMAKKDRASSDIQRMRAIKKSVPAEDWPDISASIIDRLGKKGDAFSPAHFLTEWNKLAPDAKAMLLNPSARKEMDDLVSLAEGAGRINAERNFSNTGNAAALIATGAGTGAAPVTTAALLLSANLSARAMTSQRFLRAMNKAARGDTAMMKAIARGDSPFAQDATTILRLAAADTAGGGAANSNGQARAVAP